MPLNNWISAFPLLAAGGFKLTSNPTMDYNCIAWAAGDNTRWWQPDDGWYWPPGVAKKQTVAAYVAAFRTLGFERCKTCDLEIGFEKIAIYVKDKPMHAAKQLPNSKWSSKLGSGDDIEHELDGLNGSQYGSHKIYMKRSIVK